jgi:hypothetical protein
MDDVSISRVRTILRLIAPQSLCGVKINPGPLPEHHFIRSVKAFDGLGMFRFSTIHRCLLPGGGIVLVLSGLPLVVAHTGLVRRFVLV